VGAQLRLAGFQSLRIETGDDFGGVWYWNRYPGAPSASNPIANCGQAR
jgi:cation diffusion facilitator CzcD-associated flavoprotein CzcO